MKKRTIAGLVVALGVFAGSAAYAGGCVTCGESGGCGSLKAAEGFRAEAVTFQGQLKVKNLELASEYSKKNIHNSRIDALNSEIMQLKAKIRQVAQKHGVSECCAV